MVNTNFGLIFNWAEDNIIRERFVPRRLRKPELAGGLGGYKTTTHALAPRCSLAVVNSHSIAGARD